LSEAGIGFGSGGSGKGRGRGAIERTFSPEFRNRLDAWISFEPLSSETIEKVVDKFVDELRVQLAAKNVSVALTPAGREWLAVHGFDRLYGARPMARLIQSRVSEPLVDELLFGRLQNGGRVTIDAAEDDLALRVTPAGTDAAA